jgi:hypothetical protein
MTKPNPTLWQKGMGSPNPGGKRRGTAKHFTDGVLEELKLSKEDLNDDEKYQLYCVVMAKQLGRLAFKSKSEKLRLEAMKELNDRILGKPVQPSVVVTRDMDYGFIGRQLEDPAKREQLAQLTEQFADLLGAGNTGGPGDAREPRPVEALPAPEGDSPQTA